MNERRTTVVVIGAGVSGLVAAARLQRAGVAVQVLEAQARIGGRTVSAEGFDLGASWVWDSEQHVHGLLRELGLSTFLHHREGLDVYDDGHRLQRGRLPRSHVTERRIVGGAAAIAQALGERVRTVHLCRAVTEVRLADDGLVVHTTDGMQVRASHVVAAIAPSLLAHQVVLDGVPKQRVDLLRRTGTWMAEVAKVVVVYPERFWVSDGMSGRAASRVGPMQEVHDLSGVDGSPAALFGFVPRFLATDGWRESVVRQLVRLFGPAAGQPLAVHGKAWWGDPGLHAADAAFGDLELLGHAALREPLMGGRLHLVSTETSAVSPGHLDGAVERGESVARQIIAEAAELG